MNNEKCIKVWDPLVRLFHWVLAPAVLLAYLLEDDFLSVHVWAGYLVLTLVLIRMVWGVIGTRHARFTDFVYRPSTIKAYLKSVVAFRARRFIGHNPAGGAMVIALLVSLLITTVTGMATYGAEEFAGPLAGWMANASPFWGDAMEEVHEFFANTTILLVVLHVAGVLIASLQHKENLVRAMVTGCKKPDEPTSGVSL